MLLRSPWWTQMLLRAKVHRCLDAWGISFIPSHEHKILYDFSFWSSAETHPHQSDSFQHLHHESEPEDPFSFPAQHHRYQRGSHDQASDPRFPPSPESEGTWFHYLSIDLFLEILQDTQEDTMNQPKYFKPTRCVIYLTTERTQCRVLSLKRDRLWWLSEFLLDFDVTDES